MAVYLTNTFSLAMLVNDKAFIKVEPISIDRLKETLENGAVKSAISHRSTAQVLSELLGKEVEMNRINLSLRPGDILFVFQILQRPKEGQVFTEEELRQIIEQKKYKILIVEIHDFDKLLAIGKQLLGKIFRKGVEK